MSEEFYIGRMKSSLQSLLSKLECFLSLVEQGEQPSGLLLFSTRDEIRPLFDCLWKLSLPGDARKLAETLLALEAWIVGPQMNEVLADICASEPEKTEWFRRTFGEFPSVQALADTKEEREKRYSQVMSQLRALADHVRQIHEATNYEVDKQPIRVLASLQTLVTPVVSTEPRTNGEEGTPASMPPVPGAVAELPPVSMREEKTIAGLVFRPGSFSYRTARVALKGNPLIVLRSFVEAPDRIRTVADLYKLLYADKADGRQESTIRTHVNKARTALRKAIKNAEVEFDADPLPAIDRGTGALAWQLAELP